MKDMEGKLACGRDSCREMPEAELGQVVGGADASGMRVDQPGDSTSLIFNASIYDMSINRDINDYGPIITSNNASPKYDTNNFDSIITSSDFAGMELKTDIISLDLILHNEIG